MLDAGSLQLLHGADNLVNLVGAQHKINMRRPLNELFPFLLSHAAGDAQQQIRIFPLQALDFANLAIHLVLCRLPHAAGINHDEVSLLHALRRFIANPCQFALHALRIAEIHLTAIG